MNQMQKSTSHDLEIRDFINDCHILHKISISIIKKLNYFIITNNFTTEVSINIVKTTLRLNYEQIVLNFFYFFFSCRF